MSTIRINRPDVGLTFVWRGGHTVNVYFDTHATVPIDALSCGNWETGETTLADIEAAIRQYLADRDVR